MKYTKSERIDIGRQVYTKELTIAEAKEKYEIGKSTVERYMLDYKLANEIPKASRSPYPSKITTKPIVSKKSNLEIDLDAYYAMTKEELIRELILSKANELRAKKGYEVKGDGPNKEFVSLNNKNFK